MSADSLLSYIDYIALEQGTQFVISRGTASDITRVSGNGHIYKCTDGSQWIMERSRTCQSVALGDFKPTFGSLPKRVVF
jgi:hypothetical protein